jgi:GTP cyclohydrolase I
MNDYRYKPATAGQVDSDLAVDSDPELVKITRDLLGRLGEDPERQGLRDTPDRVARALQFLTSGYSLTPEDVVKDAVFEEQCNEMVVVRDIEFYSLCEHHILPFFGKAHVGYLPRNHLIGLSKIARIVDVFSRRLQVQERMTNQIADALMDTLKPHGVAVVVDASHFCMMMRGVQKQNSSAVTSAMRGSYQTTTRTRAEFMELIRR